MNHDQELAINNEVLPLTKQAMAITVSSKSDRDLASFFVDNVKKFKADIEQRFHPTANKKQAYEAYQSALDTEKAFYDPLDNCVKIVTATVKEYDRKEAIAQQQIIAAADAKRREEERKERERLEAQAQKAEAKGNVEKAEALREQAETVSAAPVFTPTTQPVKKLITKARVTNMVKLCALIVAGEIPYNVVEVSLSNLNAWAKTQEASKKYEGIELYQDVNSRV